MSTSYRESCNYAITKDGKAYFLNFDYLKSDDFGYYSAISTKDKYYITSETFSADNDFDYTYEGEFLPNLYSDDLISLINGSPSDAMKLILNASEISDIKFDKVIRFYFKYSGLALKDSYCKIFKNSGAVIYNEFTIVSYDIKYFDLLDFSKEYLDNKMNVKKII